MEDIKSLSNDKLREEIRKIEARLKKKPNSKNPIDKFTKMDDLLRENIILQRELIEETHITNKILVALYIQEGKDGSMIAKPIAGVNTEDILKGLKGGNDYKTIVKNIGNEKITGSEKVFELNGSGILAECKFQSNNSTVNNKAYSVRIVSDKDLIYYGTWSNFESRSYYEADMTCYEDAINGYYILSFKKVAYLKNLRIEVYDSQASFTNIYIKYHEKS